MTESAVTQALFVCGKDSMKSTLVFVTQCEMQHLIRYRAARRRRYKRRKAVQHFLITMHRHFCSSAEVALIRISSITLAVSSSVLWARTDDGEVHFAMLMLFILACTLVFVPAENLYSQKGDQL